MSNHPLFDRFRHFSRSLSESFVSVGKKTKLKSTINLLTREIYLRKSQFGIDCYDVMVAQYVDPETATVNTEMNNNGDTFVEPVGVMNAFAKVYNDMAVTEEHKIIAQSNIDMINANLELESSLRASATRSTHHNTSNDTNGSNDNPNNNDIDKHQPLVAIDLKSQRNLNVSGSLEQSSQHASLSTPSEHYQPDSFPDQLALSLSIAGSSVMSAATRSKFRTEMMFLDRDLNQMKEQFGIVIYEIMTALGDFENYEGNDINLRKILHQAKEDIKLPLNHCYAAEAELKEIEDNDLKHGPTISHRDIAAYIEQNPTMYAMLAVNLESINEVEAKVIAARVVIELMSGKLGRDGLKATLYQLQFKRFQMKYIIDPKGTQEFFHRCVFAAFDSDGNSVLDHAETDAFLDSFYVSGSIFHGDTRLPDKEDLKRVILEQLDVDGDGEFTFEEIRDLISGSALRGDLKQAGSQSSPSGINDSNLTNRKTRNKNSLEAQASVFSLKKKKKSNVSNNSDSKNKAATTTSSFGNNSEHTDDNSDIPVPKSSSYNSGDSSNSSPIPTSTTAKKQFSMVKKKRNKKLASTMLEEQAVGGGGGDCNDDGTTNKKILSSYGGYNEEEDYHNDDHNDINYHQDEDKNQQHFVPPKRKEEQIEEQPHEEEEHEEQQEEQEKHEEQEQEQEQEQKQKQKQEEEEEREDKADENADSFFDHEEDSFSDDEEDYHH